MSTLNASGVTVIDVRGASSVALSVCAPSESGVDVVMQTLPLPAELKVPIETPSMDAAYDDSPPSPIR